MDAHNVDDIIFSRPPLIAPESVPASVPVPEQSISFDPTPEEVAAVTTADSPKNDSQPPEVKPEVITDDYGIPIEPKKERVFTESEVQSMIRDRLSRGQYAQQQQPTTPQVPDNFEYDNNSSEDWQTQLESFVEKTLIKRDQKLQNHYQQQQDIAMQSQFEDKFNRSASKYNDFESVVMGKPLTPSMLVATRGMDDPAAFIYAASKTQVPELDRISKINDPLSQAIELGRLEERMRKIKSGSSSAPRPIAAVTGDAVSKSVGKLSIDERIRNDAEKYLRRK